MKTETYVCQACQIDVIRPIVRGQRPRWCPDCRAKSARLRRCKGCGENAPIKGGALYCGANCRPRQESRPTPRSRTPEELAELWRSQWSDLRRAFEEGDRDGVIRAIAAKSSVTQDGCWEWRGQRAKGKKSASPYPIARFGKRQVQVHRLALEAKHGKPLGSQHAHHICANTICVNPAHLQPATHAENIGEMKARKSYEARITELEEALATLDPTHPLLAQVGIRRRAS